MKSRTAIHEPVVEEVTTVWNTIVTRRSVRQFDDSPVEDEKLTRCLEAARFAPSWSNKQCWHFVLIQGRQKVENLGIVPTNIKNTPALIVACGDPERSGNMEGRPYYLVDVAIAIEHIILEAWEQGLGSVWVGGYRESKVKKALGIPENIRVVALVPIGYPVGKETVKSSLAKKPAIPGRRKELKDIVHYGKW